MKKQRVVDFDKLVSCLGQDRIIELLGKEIPNEALVPVWQNYFDVTLTAYILSFAFQTPKEAFFLLQVCRLWYRAFNEKTFWRKYMEQKYSKDILEFFDPFHPIIWDKYKELSILGLDSCRKSPLRGPILRIVHRNLVYCQIGGPKSRSQKIVCGKGHSFITGDFLILKPKSGIKRTGTGVIEVGHNSQTFKIRRGKFQMRYNRDDYKSVKIKTEKMQNTEFIRLNRGDSLITYGKGRYKCAPPAFLGVSNGVVFPDFLQKFQVLDTVSGKRFNIKLDPVKFIEQEILEQEEEEL